MSPVGRVVAKYIKMSPYKMRKVMDLVRGKDVDSAMAILENTDKKAGVYLVRALKSAIASAKQGGKIKQDELFVEKITADDGPMARRFRAAAMGRATMIRKRTTHIIIELGAKTKSVTAKPKAAKK
ncbi:MAG: 50S ribosomal protein L22 [Candidatus Omnitrophota bacterium]